MTHPKPSARNGEPGNLSVRRIGAGQVVTGSTEAIMEFLGLSPQHNEHCKGWRWHLYMQDNDKRIEAMRAEGRKIIAERRAREDAAESECDMRKNERV